MAEKKEQLNIPELPNVVAGDGRHVMALLRRYLKEMSVQINLANGFEGVPETSSGYAAPPSFALRFTTEGGELSWNDVGYYDKLAYYEVRTDRNVGSNKGLLRRTTETRCKDLPPSRSGTVYLYAVLKDTTYSNPSVLTYTKPAPEAPQKINLTKNEQGTLIQFTGIPLNCIGANIYVDGVKYQSDDSIFLYNGAKETIESVSVAYYDQFGEGERTTISAVLPSVEGFIVERNGAVLDFYWEPVKLYGAQYVVQVSETPVWGSGVELFTTALTRKKLEYPNPGGKYFLIKVFDEHGNYSKEPTWYRLITAEDITRNSIVVFDEGAADYPGNKIGLYYDASTDALRLSDGVLIGEYIFAGELPQKYKARNWADWKLSTIINSGLRVMDLTFPLNSPLMDSLMTGGGRVTDAEATEVRTYIATYTGETAGDVFLASLADTLNDEGGNAPAVAQHADTFDSGRWSRGLYVSDLTRLGYRFSNKTPQFHSLFSVKFTGELDLTPIAKWSGADGWLELLYDDGFYLEGSDGVRLFVPYEPVGMDIITFGVSQDKAERSLYIKVINTAGQDIFSDTKKAPPVGIMTSIQFHKGDDV